jgi:hypothetical protein
MYMAVYLYQWKLKKKKKKIEVKELPLEIGGGGEGWETDLDGGPFNFATTPLSSSTPPTMEANQN